MNTNNLTKEDLIDLCAKMMEAGMFSEENPLIPKTRDENWYWQNGKPCAATNTEKKYKK